MSRKELAQRYAVQQLERIGIPRKTGVAFAYNQDHLATKILLSLAGLSAAIATVDGRLSERDEQKIEAFLVHTLAQGPIQVDIKDFSMPLGFKNAVNEANVALTVSPADGLLTALTLAQRTPTVEVKLSNPSGSKPFCTLSVSKNTAHTLPLQVKTSQDISAQLTTANAISYAEALGKKCKLNAQQIENLKLNLIHSIPLSPAPAQPFNKVAAKGSYASRLHSVEPSTVEFK